MRIISTYFGRNPGNSFIHCDVFLPNKKNLVCCIQNKSFIQYYLGKSYKELQHVSMFLAKLSKKCEQVQKFTTLLPKSQELQKLQHPSLKSPKSYKSASELHLS